MKANLFVFSLLVAVSSSGVAAEPLPPNVLFIAVDDLRPELGCYGQADIVSPNIDRLAAEGVVFNRAYCMVPTCGASRASLFTGIRPARDRFVGYLARADKDAPGVKTFNTHFKEQGYYTLSLGKVLHHADDSAAGWSEPAWRPNAPMYRLPENESARAERAKERGVLGRGPSYEAADVPDDAYADGQVAQKAIDELRRLKEKREPFLLAVGFYKPHLPFAAPQKYWDLYDAEKVQLPDNYHRPKGAPAEALHNWGELRLYSDIPPKGPLSDEKARKLIHGYYACVSYTDAQIGKVLDELKRLKLDESTIVVLWGDHGWNLGEHTLWCKHSCFETSMRIPLIVKAPQVEGGKKTDGLTESIDIYPSLCQLTGRPLPEHLEGTSFVPLLRDPGNVWKPFAIGRFGSGDTIRSDRYRFSEYTRPDGKFQARMLYDHHADPDENENISEQPRSKSTVEELTGQLHQGMGKPRRAGAGR